MKTLINQEIKRIPVAKGWAKTSVNVAIFRRSAIMTHNEHQYLAFYDAEARVVLAKRTLCSDGSDSSEGSEDWQLHVTQYSGNVHDAHNVISLIVDGEGYLHLSWDHHNHPLKYSRSLEPEGLELSSPLTMTSSREAKVTYPQFYRLANGNLLFFFRDGSSGNGDLLFNHYDCKTNRWTRPIDNLIDGENERNAYWQICTDKLGNLHLSWVWRETPDVMTNHDICYAVSTDGGHSWQKSDGSAYTLPITQASAEYACRIPQNSKLANQTSMCADAQGRPYIVNYWQIEGATAPQYHLVFFDGTEWQRQQVSERQSDFDLQGTGTKKVPISRPQIAADSTGDETSAYIIYRDNERSGGISIAYNYDLSKANWETVDILSDNLGFWEPNYDFELWSQHKELHFFVQKVGQGDGETLEDIEAQMVEVIEWKSKE